MPGGGQRSGLGSCYLERRRNLRRASPGCAMMEQGQQRAWASGRAPACAGSLLLARARGGQTVGCANVGTRSPAPGMPPSRTPKEHFGSSPGDTGVGDSARPTRRDGERCRTGGLLLAPKGSPEARGKSQLGPELKHPFINEIATGNFTHPAWWLPYVPQPSNVPVSGGVGSAGFLLCRASGGRGSCPLRQ